MSVSPEPFAGGLALELIEDLDDAVICFNRNFEYTLLNRAAERLLRASRSELLGKTLWDVFPATVGTLIESQYLAAAAGRAVRFEYHYPEWNRWYELHARPLSGGGIAVRARDISERRDTEAERDRIREEAAEQARLLHLVMSTAPVGIAVLGGPDMRFRWANSFYYSFVEAPYRDGDISGERLADVVPGTEEAGVVDIFRRVIETGEPFATVEYEHRGFARGITYWRYSVLPLTVGSGGREALLVVTEVTEQVEARRRAERLAAAIEEDRSRLAALLLGLSESVIIADGDGNVLMMNASALERHAMGGVEEARRHVLAYRELFEMRYPDGSFMPEDEWPIVRTLRGEEVQDYEALVTHLPTGQSFVGSYRGRAVRDNEGRISRVILTLRDITEQKRAEAELRNSERRMRAVLDGLYVFVGLLSADGQVLETNSAPLEAAGIGRADVIGRRFWDCYWWSYSPEVQARVRNAVERARAGEMVRFDVDIRIAGEARMTIDFAIAPVRDAAGEITHLIPSASDITERKREERRREFLLDLSERLARMTDAAAIAKEGASLIGYRLCASRAALCLVSPESGTVMVGEHYRRNETIPPLTGEYSLHDLHPAIVEAGLSRRTLVRGDAGPAPAPRRYPFDSEALLAVPLWRGGEWMAMLLLHEDHPRTWDADEIRLAEDAAARLWPAYDAARLMRDIQNREEHFRALADSIPQLVWVANTAGEVEYVNTEWHHYTGGGEDLALGWTWERIVHPDDLELCLARWTGSFQTGAPYEIEYRLRRHDGVYRWFLGRARPVLDASGRVVRWFGTCTDIHDNKEVEGALRRSNYDLEQFAYVASHDLQEPLRNISAFAELLRRRYSGRLDKDAEQFLTHITNGSARMTALVRGLLEYSRAGGSSADGLQQVNCEVVLRTVLRSLNTQIEESGAQVRFGAMPVVMADPNLLSQVFQNLIGNAIKYRKPDVRPEIRVTAQRDRDFYTFSVEDNGIGFQPQYAGRIFGVFKRLHTTYPGTGIGLAIVKRIVERAGGRVWAESSEGQGSTFYFTWPGA